MIYSAVKAKAPEITENDKNGNFPWDAVFYQKSAD